MDLFKTRQGEEIERLQQENDELRAYFERVNLKFCEISAEIAYLHSNQKVNEDGFYVDGQSINEFARLLSQTPKQSLTKIKADAIREMLDEVWRSDTERVDIEDYATNLEQDND